MRRHIDNRGDQEHNNCEKKILERTGYSKECWRACRARLLNWKGSATKLRPAFNDDFLLCEEVYCVPTLTV